MDGEHREGVGCLDRHRDAATPPQRAQSGAYDRALAIGLTELAPILRVVFDAVAKTVDHQIECLCRQDRYRRIHGQLRQANPAMDDASYRNVGGLLTDAKRIVDANTTLETAGLTPIAAARDRQSVTT